MIITINAPEQLQCATVLSLDAHCRISALSAYQLKIVMEPNTDYGSYINKAIHITLSTDFETVPVYGHVVSVELQYTNNIAIFSIMPKLFQLGLNKHARVFYNHSPITILQELCQHHQITLNRDYVLKSYEKQDTIAQYNETDFDFISRLLEQSGLFYYFKNTKDKSILTLCDNLNSLTLHPETFHIKAATQQHQPHFFEWREIKKAALNSSTAYSFNPDQAQDDLQYHSQLARAFSYTWFENINENIYCPNLIDTKELKLKIDAREKYWGFHANHIKAKLSMIDVDPGQKLYCQTTDKTYFVVESYLSISENRFQHHLVLCDTSQGYATKQQTPKPKIKGLSMASVDTFSNAPVSAKSSARVQAHYFWDSNTITQAPWIRVLQNTSGANWGSVFLPYKNEHVLIAFNQGDIDSPVILGSVYHRNQTRPFTLPKQKDISGYRFSPKSELLFHHSAKKNKISLKTAGDQSQHIQHSHNSVVSGSFSTTVKKGDSCTYIQSGNALVTAKTALQAKVNQSSLSITPDGIHISAATINLNNKITSTTALANKSLDKNGTQLLAHNMPFLPIII